MKIRIYFIILLLLSMSCMGFTALSRDGEKVIVFEDAKPKIINLKNNEIQSIQINDFVWEPYYCEFDGDRIVFVYRNSASKNYSSSDYLYNIKTKEGRILARGKQSFGWFRIVDGNIFYVQSFGKDNGNRVEHELDEMNLANGEESRISIISSPWDVSGCGNDDIYFVKFGQIIKYSIKDNSQKVITNVPPIFFPMTIISSPSGKKFFLSNSSESYLVDMEIKLSRAEFLGDQIGQMVWAPDSTRFVYTRIRGDRKQSGLYIYNTGDKNIAWAMSDMSFSIWPIGWSKSINKIVYVKRNITEHGKQQFSIGSLDPVTYEVNKIYEYEIPLRPIE